MGRYGSDWPRYIPVAERREKAVKKVKKLQKKGMVVCPVEIEGRKIARTFWGSGWCKHLESFSDYANRLPRGRSYVRQGAVCHLAINEGSVEAMVSGSHLYNVQVSIDKLPEWKWKQLKKQCAGQIGSLLELLQGKLSKNIMALVTDSNNGLFPLPAEIHFSCDCPDWAVMCKHVAAVLYGVGARLDEQPELLFLLRGVNVDDLISEGAAEAITAGTGSKKRGKGRRVADADLEDVFGIDLGDVSSAGNADSEAAGLNEEGKGSEAKPGPGRKKRSNPGQALAEKIKCGKIRGPAVAGLRADFGMTQSQFARLIGVSVATICNWEKNRGNLKLQERTRKALLEAVRLNNEEHK